MVFPPCAPIHRSRRVVDAVQSEGSIQPAARVAHRRRPRGRASTPPATRPRRLHRAAMRTRSTTLQPATLSVIPLLEEVRPAAGSKPPPPCRAIPQVFNLTKEGVDVIHPILADAAVPARVRLRVPCAEPIHRPPPSRATTSSRSAPIRVKNS